MMLRLLFRISTVTRSQQLSRLTRPLATSVPHPQSTPLLPQTPPLTAALSHLSSLPEIPQALTSRSPQTAQTLLHRALQISSATLSPLHTALIHSLLSSLHHVHANHTQERHHRLLLISNLDRPADQPAANPHLPHLAAAHLAFALACLRVPAPQALFAASVAAETAQSLATTSALRTAASLVVALSAPKGSRVATTLLTALLNLEDGESPDPELDVVGFARVGMILRADANDVRADHAKALVVRWEGAGYDFVEALCVAAGAVKRVGERDLAEDFLGRALRTAGDLGNELDKSEALLGLAILYEEGGNIVEAEGMYRAVEERFDKVREKGRFTVSSADVYCRAMERFASFLERAEVNGVKRDKEAALRRQRAAEARALFPEILGESRGDDAVPLWVVDSLLPHFELPVPAAKADTG